MALTPFAFELLRPLIRGRVLSFGYPDLLLSPEEVTALIGKPLTSESEHGAAHKKKGALAETGEVIRAMGASFLCVDLFQTRSVEQVLDLNEPCNFGLNDLVIDAGTSEHCANIGQVVMNAASAVTVGGYVFHSPPASMVNHGFFNVSPTFLVDFYQQNGWRIAHLSGFFARAPFSRVDLPAHARYNLAPDVAIYFLAERTTSAPLRWPVQWKYLPPDLREHYREAVQ